MAFKRANIIDIKRGLRQSRLYKNKQTTPKNFASSVDLLIPDAAFGDVEANSKIDLPEYVHSEGQGFTVQVDEISDVAVIQIDASTGTSTTYGDIRQTADGSRVKFNGSADSYVSGTVQVYLNQQEQVKGTDFTESDSSSCEITMSIAPLATDSFVISYHQTSFTPDIVFATSESSNANQQLTGSINGVNKVFTTPGVYKSGTLKVYLNGGLQTQGTTSDWTETTSTTFTFVTEPDSPDVVSVIYESANGGRRYETTENTLSFTFDGSSTAGTTSSPYEPGSLELSWQGQLLTPGNDYYETDPSAGRFNTVSGISAGGVLGAAYTVGNNASPRNEEVPVSTPTTSTSLTIYDSIVLTDATSGAVTITLPAVANVTGLIYYIKKTDSSVNAVTVATDGAETIDGETTVRLNQYDSLTVVSDGSNWSVI